MKQIDFYNQLLDSIKIMAEKNNTPIINTAFSKDFVAQIAESIKNNQDNITKLGNFNRSNLFSKEMLDSIIEKFEAEKQDKLHLFEVAFDKKKKIICELFQKIDHYVLNGDIIEPGEDINLLLEQLSSAADDRDGLLQLIKEYKKQASI
ncbi:MAG: hypothetical protein V4677_07510 [Bacteroidota bacterium]